MLVAILKLFGRSVAGAALGAAAGMILGGALAIRTELGYGPWVFWTIVTFGAVAGTTVNLLIGIARLLGDGSTPQKPSSPKDGHDSTAV